MKKRIINNTKKWAKEFLLILDSPFENAAPLENASEKIIRARRSLFEMASKGWEHV